MMLVALRNKQRPGCPVIGCRNKQLRWHRGWKDFGAKLCRHHYWTFALGEQCYVLW